MANVESSLSEAILMAHPEHIEELEERLQHEVATRERLDNEGRYQALLQVISDAIFIIDSEGVYLDYIPAEGFEMLYPPEEFLGKSIHEIMPSDIAEASMHCIKEALRTNEQQRFEYDLSMGGERTHFEACVAPIGADSVLAVVRDTTEHKQANEKLRTTQEYLDTILLNLPVGVAIMEGPEFRYYRINHQLAKINGLSVEEHLDRPLAEVLPEAAPDIIPGLRHVLETGEARLDREFSTCLPKDPDVICHFIDSFFPIKGADGKPRAVGAVVVDITERKRAQEALRESEERFRDLYNNAPVAYFTVGRNGHIQRANHQAAQLLGYAPDEVIGRPVFDLYADTPDGKEKARQVFQRFVAGERTDEEELQMRHADGHLIWISLTVDLVRDAEGAILETRSIVIDITARKRAEEALRRLSQRLVEVLETERLHIARELHDEIGQVLTGIKISLQVARRVPGATTLLPNLEDMIRVAERAYQQVHDLALDLRPSLLNDLGLVPALRWFCEHYTGQTKIDVDFHYEIPRATRFDPQVEITAFRIIQEALTNVARHAGVRAVQVFVRLESEHLVLHVIDQGRGFDSTTDLARRDSLGLFGMNERIVLLGGSLKIESAPGTGTRVSASLPLT